MTRLPLAPPKRQRAIRHYELGDHALDTVRLDTAKPDCHLYSPQSRLRKRRQDQHLRPARAKPELSRSIIYRTGTTAKATRSALPATRSAAGISVSRLKNGISPASC